MEPRNTVGVVAAIVFAILASSGVSYCTGRAEFDPEDDLRVMYRANRDGNILSGPFLVRTENAARFAKEHLDGSENGDYALECHPLYAGGVDASLELWDIPIPTAADKRLDSYDCARHFSKN